jgi:hypothetical protein
MSFIAFVLRHSGAALIEAARLLLAGRLVLDAAAGHPSAAGAHSLF